MARCTLSAMADALYRLLAWLSPAYPIGGFSYSHGIETAIEEGFILNRPSLVAWLQTVLGAVSHGRGDRLRRGRADDGDRDCAGRRRRLRD